MMPNETKRTFDQLPCDFLAFLAQRLKLDERAALDTLGSFLVGYEPSDDARAQRVARGDTPPPAPAMLRQSKADVAAAAA